jgi:pyruvate/2-oxoglutarate dehydrogenase complex dihydrolipoamide dehydrogenase (E3) component
VADQANEVDVVVIGLGVGGEEVAGRLAEAGLDVVGIERELVGGECPYWGCVPSKMIIRGANLLQEARRIDGVSGTAEVHPDFAPVATRIRVEATDTWDDKVAVDRYVGKGGRFVRGSASVRGPREVAVGDEVFSARRGIVVATGAAPVIPPIDGLADAKPWTNREAISTEHVPDRLLVLGGGAIGLELAQAFSRFGSHVTVVEAMDRLLPPEEPEAGALLAEVLQAQGMDVRVGAKAVRVTRAADGTVEVELEGGDVVSGDEVLVSTGRRPNTAGLGLEAAGLPADGRAVEVDERMRAGDGLWAVGDVTGVGQFTHMAMYQAGIAVADILGQEHAPADYRGLARVTFTDPEVGSVGLTERDAREQGIEVRTGQSKVSSSARGWIHGPGNEGFIKLVVDDGTGLLVGATSAGPWGGEVLAMLTLAVHAKVPVATLRTMIYAYPTFHRGVLDALTDLGE